MQERRILRRKHQIFNFHHHDSFAGRNNGMLAMFYTLYTKKRHEDSRSRKITNKYASSTGETESDAKSVSAITMIPSNPSSLSRII